MEKSNDVFGCCLMYLGAFYKAVLNGEKGTLFSPLFIFVLKHYFY